MADTVIHCPECGAEIPVSEALGVQIREETEARVREEQAQMLRRAVSEAEGRARDAMRAEMQGLEDRAAEKARVAEREQGLLQSQMAAQRKKLEAAQAAELQLRQQRTALEERQRELDLEVARKLDEERQRLEAGIRQSVGEEQSLKLKEKEKQIDDLRKALEDAKRRSELGSQELQGEVLEVDIQAEMERLFPHDLIEPVVKGRRGADIIQRVRDERQRDCGSIVWETKNTKHWQPTWLDKLKQDQRAGGGNLAVIVSVALPDGVRGFGRLDGVWVSDLASWPALAAALREQLLQVAFAHAASEGKSEKMELMYRYLSGEQFRHKVQGIVEAFTAMQQQLERERRAMERLWKEREKQIERVVGNTVGMYGEMRGIVGAGIPAIAALELDDDLLEGPEES